MMKFSDWMKLKEDNNMDTQDMTMQAVKQTANTSLLKPGQSLANLIKDPKEQSKILDRVNQISKQARKPVKIGAVINSLDTKTNNNPYQQGIMQ